MVLRTCNLGTFSLDLDELYLVCRARGSFGQALSRCLENAEHPPLSALAMAVGYHLGLGDTLQRLVPVALGVGALLLLATWAAHHWNPQVGRLVGVLGALSPFHIRYSQELRPYAYVLLFAALTLVVTDRLLERPGWRSAPLAALALAGGLYSHLQFPVVLVAVLVLLLPAAWAAEPDERSRGRRTLAWFLSALTAAGLAYLPWALATVGRVAEGAGRGGVEDWTWWRVAQRWQFLTGASREFDPPRWTGAAMAALLLLGAARATMSRAGRATLAAALVGTAGVELLLVRANHWSDARYDLTGWLFLLVLVSLGADWLCSRPRLKVAGRVAIAALLAANLPVIDAYQRIGRPGWDRLAEVVRMVREAGEPILVENRWCRVQLAYYLEGEDYQAPTGPADLVRSFEAVPEQLRAAWPAEQTAVLVLGRFQRSDELHQAATRLPHLVDYYNTARVYRVVPELRQRAFDDGESLLGPGRPGWPDPTLRLLPEALCGQPHGCLASAWRSLQGSSQPSPENLRLDLEPTTAVGSLLGCWSPPRKAKDGTTSAWVTGYEAGLVLECHAPRPLRVRVRLWPYPHLRRPQRLRIRLNDHLLGETTLARGAAVLDLSAPASAWRQGRNLLVLQPETCAVPAEVEPDSQDRRALAAAVDWVEAVQVGDAPG